MGALFLPQRTVGEAVRNLIRAADELERERGRLDRTVAALEARWAANRLAVGPQTTEVDAINLVLAPSS